MAKSRSEPANDTASQVQSLSIDSLHIDPANVRVHDERNKSTIRASLARFGAGRSIVLDRNNVVRAGNGTLEQARQAGFDEVLVIEPKPNQIVAVKRPDWSDTEATAYSVQDNRSTDLSRNDDPVLAATLRALQNEQFDLEAVGYEASEVDQLIESLAGDMARQSLDTLANTRPPEGSTDSSQTVMAGMKTFIVVLTDAQEGKVREAIRLCKSQNDLETTPDAISWLCTQYLDMNREP